MSLRVPGRILAAVSGAMCALQAGATPLATAADAARFLEQSSFGPTTAEMAQVQKLGIPAYLDQQLAAAATTYSAYDYRSPNSSVGCLVNLTGQCYRDYYTLFRLQMNFFRNAVTAKDQLRQRVAFALSQILVTSGVVVNQPYGMANYQNLLLKDAFGNYRQLLEDVTLSPVMGTYLNMADNDKPDPVQGTSPNENYAREVMQLFSIGLMMLKPDGTPVLDAAGNAIPTYVQDTVEGFSSVFTGWTYAPRPLQASRWANPLNYDGKMAAFAGHHDPAAKKLLNGTVLPPGQAQDTDLKQALDNLFNHPNVGPFLGRQLIQQLVTSNPSPAYVARITAVFNDNGRGVRGDLGSVVRAVLLDPEARGDLKTDSSYGKLREPALYIAGLLRGIGGKSQTDGEYPLYLSAQMGEDIYSPPTVFNYYPPDYALPGSSLVGPPFGIYGATTAFARIGLLDQLLAAKVNGDSTVLLASGTSLDLSAWKTAAADSAGLVAAINQQFFHVAMSSGLQGAVLQTVNAIPASDTTDRAKAALYLALGSSEYQVER